MTNTATINLDKNGKATITQDPNPLDLGYNSSATMDVGSGFPEDSWISAMGLYANTTAGGTAAKGDPIGVWTKTEDIQPSADLVISANGTGIQVKDVNQKPNGAADTFWFSLKVTDGTSTWSADPEMIVRAKLPTLRTETSTEG